MIVDSQIYLNHAWHNYNMLMSLRHQQEQLCLPNCLSFEKIPLLLLLSPEFYVPKVCSLKGFYDSGPMMYVMEVYLKVHLLFLPIWVMEFQVLGGSVEEA